MTAKHGISPTIPIPEQDQTDVCKYEQTWVHQFLKGKRLSFDFKRQLFGTTICNTGYDGKDYKDISFIGRVNKLIKASFFEKTISINLLYSAEPMIRGQTPRLVKLNMKAGAKKTYIAFCPHSDTFYIR